MIEQEILALIKAARIRLRFDKVVLRLAGSLNAALAGVIPQGEAVILTVTAPIRRGARTATVIESVMRDGLPEGERREAIHGNQIRIRRLTDIPPQMPRLLVFVHSPESDAGLILALAEARLSARKENARATSIK